MGRSLVCKVVSLLELPPPHSCPFNQFGFQIVKPKFRTRWHCGGRSGRRLGGGQEGSVSLAVMFGGSRVLR